MVNVAMHAPRMLGLSAACGQPIPACARRCFQWGIPTQYDRVIVAYLCDALVAVERYSLTIGTVDWPRIKATAIAEAEPAQSLDDRHPVIRSMLGSLGDNHSILLAPNRAAQLRGPTAQVDRVVMVPDTTLS